MKKKMKKNQATLHTGYSVPKYLPGKEPRVEYYVVDLKDNNKTIRKRIRMKNVPEEYREQHAKQVIADIYDKLKKGWHPDKGFKQANDLSIKDVIDKYRMIKESQFKAKEVRQETITNTNSKTSVFEAWLKANKIIDYSIDQLTKRLAMDFFDYLHYTRKIGAVTHNNYLIFFNTMFNVLVEKEVVINNPFKGIKLKRTKQKSKKVPLTKDERMLVKKWGLENNPHFYLICLLMFHTGLRRKELTLIKIGDIDVKNQVIYVGEEVAKMKKERFATMTKQVIDLMISLNVLSAPTRFYLIGRNWKPADQPITPKKISDEWRKMRTKLNLHPQAVLYSLRKTGAIQKAEDGMSMQGVKDFLGHTGMEAAAHYMENHRFKGNDEIKRKSSDF